jgi:hypothetical protein
VLSVSVVIIEQLRVLQLMARLDTSEPWLARLRSNGPSSDVVIRQCNGGSIGHDLKMWGPL